MSSQNTPRDLNSILRTLSAFSNQTNPHTHQTSFNNHHIDDNENDYEPPDAHHSPIAESQAHQQPRQPPSTSPQSSFLHHTSQANRSIQEKDLSSTITTWPAALKQVMRTVSQNEDTQRRIRFLIQRQHDHEKQWWKGREVLLQKQKSRKEKKRELDEVLRSVGAPVDEKEISTAEEDVAEIQNYDAKVYKASRQMADAMLLELKALDVPFFSIKQRLVITDETEKQKQKQENSTSATRTPDKQGRLSLDELSALQRRMLELLQDLCRD